MNTKNKPQRKPNRLKNFDYNSYGSYFITICTNNRQCILWKKGFVLDIDSNKIEKPLLSRIGEIIDCEILKWQNIYNNVTIDNYAIMPNHIHLLISMVNVNDTLIDKPTCPTISKMIQQFKSSITKQVGNSIWQKSFYDHIIRGNDDYFKIWDYIDNNPINWRLDELYKDC